MSSPRVVTLTHANSGDRIEMVADNVFYQYWSPAHKATHIVSTGGAWVPVRESLDDVVARLYPGSGRTPESPQENPKPQNGMK